MNNPLDPVVAREPQVHELKTDPAVFDATWEGSKSCEIRCENAGKNIKDMLAQLRDFQVGDELWLRRTRYTGAEMAQGAPLEYTGHELRTPILHVLRGGYGLKPGWVLLSHEQFKNDPIRG